MARGAVSMLVTSWFATVPSGWVTRNWTGSQCALRRQPHFHPRFAGRRQLHQVHGRQHAGGRRQFFVAHHLPAHHAHAAASRHHDVERVLHLVRFGQADAGQLHQHRGAVLAAQAQRGAGGQRPVLDLARLAVEAGQLGAAGRPASLAWSGAMPASSPPPSLSSSPSTPSTRRR